MPEPLILSPSSIEDYACPLRWRLGRLDRLPSKPAGEPAVRGTVVHEALERVFDLPAPQRTREALSGLLEPAWRALTPEDKAVAPWDVVRPAAERAVDVYLTLEDPRRYEPAGREVEVRLALEGDVLVRGYIDRVDVAPDGRVRIMDYKAGKIPPYRYRGDKVFQLLIYALAYWREYRVIPTVVTLIYVSGRGARISQEPTEESLLATERRILDVAASIRRDVARKAFQPKPGPLCGWCDFRAACPAQGGTLPPFPDPVVLPRDRSRT